VAIVFEDRIADGNDSYRCRPEIIAGGRNQLPTTPGSCDRRNSAEVRRNHKNGFIGAAPAAIRFWTNRIYTGSAPIIAGSERHGVGPKMERI